MTRSACSKDDCGEMHHRIEGPRVGSTEAPVDPQTRDHVALALAGTLGMERNGTIKKHIGGREDSVCDRLGLHKPRRGRCLVAFKSLVWAMSRWWCYSRARKNLFHMS